MMVSGSTALAILVALAGPVTPSRTAEAAPPLARSQDPVPEDDPAAVAVADFRLGGELKAGYRWSQAQSSRVFFPFPANFRPPGQTDVFMRTPDAGSSLELQHLALTGEGSLASGVHSKFEVRFLDLYNRNPTSSDDRVFVRQAHVRFGEKAEPLSDGADGRLYVLAGLAPRFSKQVVRRMEGYGLWGTAVSRFEQLQVEAGGRLGARGYFRVMAGSGNPVFMRDTNALAGDNGTPERQPGAVNPIHESGFPILYDAKPVDIGGRFEWGGGVGARFGPGETPADPPAPAEAGSESVVSADVLAWFFTRRLSDTVRLRGTSYSGDLRLLRGVAFPLPFSGDRKYEWGVNVHARRGDVRAFAQWVKQEIANLPRRGFEAEVSWTRGLNGLFLVGESPAINWIQPSLRASWIDNRFEAPLEYPAPSIDWDWWKFDAAVRVGVVRDVDLTAEGTWHKVHRVEGLPNLPMKEFLLTLRVGF
jgi:hypothetical protein